MRPRSRSVALAARPVPRRWQATPWLCSAPLALALIVLGTQQAGASRLSPSIERRYEGPSQRARHSVVQVERKRELVERGLLEYAPAEMAAPTVDPFTGDVFVGTRDGWVRLFDRMGRVVWGRDLGARPMGPARMTDAAIYLGTADGQLHALDRFSGEPKWSNQIRAQVLAAPAEDVGVLVVGTNQDAVLAFDAETGDALWSYRRSAGLHLSIQGGTSVTLDEGRIFAGFSDGSIAALGVDDGRLLWQAATAPGSVRRFPDADAAPVVRDGVVYSTVFNDGVYAFDADSGKIRWRHDAPGAHSLAVEGSTLLVGGARHALALEADTGARIWAVDLGSSYVSQPVVARRVVFLAGPEGLRMVDWKTGRPLGRFQPGSGFGAPPVPVDDGIWALSNLGFLYELRITATRGGDAT